MLGRGEHTELGGPDPLKASDIANPRERKGITVARWLKASKPIRASTIAQHLTIAPPLDEAPCEKVHVSEASHAAHRQVEDDDKAEEEHE